MNTNEPLVSIIMPVYNCEKYISEAIESVIGQSYLNWELLIIDDGSMDESGKIIDTYAKKNKRIKVYHKKNEGVSRARNLGLDKANGELITFIDADDIYDTCCLKERVNIFKQYLDCDIVISRHDELKHGLKQNLTVTDSDVVIETGEDLLKTIISDTRNHFVWNTMIKAEIAKMNRFPSFQFAEDYCYIRDCVNQAEKIILLNQKLYFYRRDNKSSIINNFFSEKHINSYMELPVNFSEFCIKNNKNEPFYKKVVAHEYAQSSMRIRKSTSYSRFVKCMNDERFRSGLKFADSKECTWLERVLFYLIEHKFYFPFLFWVWK